MPMVARGRACDMLLHLAAQLLIGADRGSGRLIFTHNVVSSPRCKQRVARGNRNCSAVTMAAAAKSSRTSRRCDSREHVDECESVTAKCTLQAAMKGRERVVSSFTSG